MSRLSRLLIVASWALMINATFTIAAPFTVPGTANVWLAGMPYGTVAADGADLVPAQSPVLVPGPIGATYSFAATGATSNDPFWPFAGPDGDPGFVLNRAHGPENGIADIFAPIDALLGLFLDDNPPNLSAPPVALDFSTEASRDFLSLSPELRQPFYIGDGLTTAGQSQEFFAPPGATRLFLGTMDGHGSNNNIGELSVTINAVPEPSNLLLAAVGLVGVAFYRGRKIP